MTPQQVMPYMEVVSCLMSYSSHRQSWQLCSWVQMADMQRQMASLPPGFVQQQMASLNSMPPEVLQQRMREASAVEPQGRGQHTLIPSPHQQQEVCEICWIWQGIRHFSGPMIRAACFCRPGSSCVSYCCHALQRLKEEGNQLFSAGKYVEAAAKYERVKSDLEGILHSVILNTFLLHWKEPWEPALLTCGHHAGHADSEAAALRQKCTLNLASCCLKMCQHDKCIQQCSEVLQSHPGERKALYRRGQSHSALKQFSAAIADLQAAVER